MTTRESIAHKFAETIISIERHYDGYPKVDTNNKKEWRCIRSRDECDFMYSGAARYWITRLNLRCWSDSVRRMTLEQLADQIPKIEFPSCSTLQGHGHGPCNPLGMAEFKLQPKIKRVLDDLLGLELSDFSTGLKA